MSAYFARIEDETISEYVPQTEAGLRTEIISFEQKLNAISNLSTFRDAVHLSEGRQLSNSTYLVITLDAERGTVTVEPQRSFRQGAEGYANPGQEGGRV